MAERRWDPVFAEWRLYATAAENQPVSRETPCPLCKGAPSKADVLVVSRTDLNGGDYAQSAAGFHAVASAFTAVELVYADEQGLDATPLGTERLRRTVDVWADRYAVLGARPDVGHVAMFEQVGSDGHCAGGHRRTHVYGFADVPAWYLQELRTARRHLAARGTCVSCDVVAHEQADGVRVVASNEHFIAYVPFAARWPFELHVTALRHATSLLDLTDPERRSLARMLLEVAGAYTVLSGDGGRYVMALRQSPTDDGDWLLVSHFRVEFAPSLGSLEPGDTGPAKQYLTGAEVGIGSSVSAVLPETSAAHLRRAVRQWSGF